jgi:hypothetical protein
MKRLKILKILFASLFMIAIVGMFSCTKSKPDCEVNNTGTITIHNDFPGAITIDVYDYYVDDFLGETVLGIGMSTTYTVHAGDFEIWEADAYSDWGYWSDSVGRCEDGNFSVYQARKSVPTPNIKNLLDTGQKILGKHK